MWHLDRRGGTSCTVFMALCAGALQCAIALGQAAHEAIPRIDPDYTTTVNQTAPLSHAAQPQKAP